MLVSDEYLIKSLINNMKRNFNIHACVQRNTEETLALLRTAWLTQQPNKKHPLGHLQTSRDQNPVRNKSSGRAFVRGQKFPSFGRLHTPV